MNATQQFLGTADDWHAARLELDTVQPLWGGRRLALTASHGVAHLINRGQSERREFDVDQAQWHDLITGVIDQDFVTIQPPDRPGIPDEARPTITLINAAGERRSVSKWAGVKDQRFDAVMLALVAVGSG